MKIVSRYFQLFVLTFSLLISEKLLSQAISTNAIILTLRDQTVGVWVDSSKAFFLDSCLTLAIQNVDTLQYINAWPIPPVVTVKTYAFWARSTWGNGNLLTGRSYIDSLSQLYNLHSVNSSPNWPYYDLRFSNLLNTEELAGLYAIDTDILLAYANTYGGDGDDIIYFEKYGEHNFIFTEGWGDCMAGCTYRNYRYITIFRCDSGLTARYYPENFIDWDLNVPIIPLWNIPEWYPLTVFSSADSVLLAITQDPNWWIRRHAIKGINLLYKFDFQIYNFEDPYTWEELKSELFGRTPEILDSLNVALGDSDIAVRESAQETINTINLTSVAPKNIQSNSFILFQNFPNPFNPYTIIKYSLPKLADISFSVYDIQGRIVQKVIYNNSYTGSRTILQARRTNFFPAVVETGTQTATHRNRPWMPFQKFYSCFQKIRPPRQCSGRVKANIWPGFLPVLRSSL